MTTLISSGTVIGSPTNVTNSMLTTVSKAKLIEEGQRKNNTNATVFFNGAFQFLALPEIQYSELLYTVMDK